MRDRQFDLSRIAIVTVLTAALAVGLAEALLYHSRHTAHVGPTSASLSDAFSAIAGACLGLAVGATVASVSVRRGSRIVAGLFAGVGGFVLGVVPWSWLTSASDVSTQDNVIWLLILFIPAVVLVFFGAGIGAAIRGGPNATRATT